MLTGWSVRAQPADGDARVVTLGGSITEIVFALGAQDYLVGVDASSVYPPEANSLPQLGYFRQVSAEGVLSLNPSVVLAIEGSGPQTSLDQIEAAGVRVQLIPADHTPEGARNRIRTTASVLGRVDEGAVLINKLDSDLDMARRLLEVPATKPKVLFIYARGGGTLNVSGSGTAADALIDLSGGRNAISGFDGYRPLTAESVVAASPDVLLLLDRGLDAIGGVEGLLRVPGVSLTPAGRHRRVIAMEDALFLNFGPRLGEAVAELSRLLYPNEASSAEASD
jgi:iron complex transport system substrate-binding protein